MFMMSCGSSQIKFIFHEQFAELPSASKFMTYFNDMKCALDLLDRLDTQKMSTGSAEIDSLIDGIQESSFYLIYSSNENQLILDSLLYRQLIGCILPKSKKKNGFESVAIFFNNIDLSADKNKHQLLNPEKIAITSKYAGIEPKIIFKNLFVQTAYNQEHQAQIADEIADKIESNPDIKLLAIRDLTKFIAKDRGTINSNVNNDDANTLKKTLGTVYRVCTKNKVAVVATGSCNIANSGIIPKPTGGTYLKHIANVIIHVKPNFWSTTITINNNNNSGSSPFVSFKASMIKHPYQRTPKSGNFYARRIGRRRNLMLFILD
jgi:RecA/RadA recombinase